MLTNVMFIAKWNFSVKKKNVFSSRWNFIVKNVMFIARWNFSVGQHQVNLPSSGRSSDAYDSDDDNGNKEGYSTPVFSSFSGGLYCLLFCFLALSEV